MHKSSLWHMQDCVNRYVVPLDISGTVLDVGSGNASDVVPYRAIFEAAGWAYHGLDLRAGPNVDVVATDPFDWDIKSNTYDAVISGQMLEHNSMFWLSFLEMARVLKPGGLMIHIAPSRGHEHRVPTDSWRFYRDGMKSISEWAGLDLVEATTDWSAGDLESVKRRRPRVYQDLPQPHMFKETRWGDTVGVFRKPAVWNPETALRYMRAYTAKYA